MRRILRIACTALLMVSVAKFAPADEPPPPGAILDLNGQPIPSSYQQYTVNFTSSLTDTTISFAFRDDPSDLWFSDTSLVDLTTSSGDLLVNGNFASYDSNTYLPTDWTYSDPYQTSGGLVNTGCGYLSDTCWDDYAVGAYDMLGQTVSTNVGDLYQISFYLVENSGNSTFQSTDPNNNSAIDVLTYAQAGMPVSVTPEPSTMALLGTGLLVLLWSMRKRLARV